VAQDGDEVLAANNVQAAAAVLAATARSDTEVKSAERLTTSWGLSGKLLMLTGLFVMLAEILIFVPSIANFRQNWLADRINAAHLAGMASDTAPGGVVPPTIRAELLSTAQVQGVSIKRMGQRRMVLPPEDEISIAATYDIRPMALGAFEQVGHRAGSISDAVMIFFAPTGRTIRVLGHPVAPMDRSASVQSYEPDDFVEIVLTEDTLRAAMVGFGLNILGLSIVISGITAALVYFALRRLLVSPMMRLAENMMKFRERPEDVGQIIQPTGRADEIGIAERELARMQNELINLLKQKDRLAQLGLAVAKVNHDLRNMLATAQLMSDRVAALPDPAVQKLSPKLIASLDRAIAFCNETLQYGAAGEAPPSHRPVDVQALINEVGEGLGLPRPTVSWRTSIEPGLVIEADPDQLYRVFNNLVRNAVQALDGAAGGEIEVQARRGTQGSQSTIVEVRDNGPGVPDAARANLFRAFRGSVRKGGSGLGLAIASELVAAHGGTLEHEALHPGAIFRCTLPSSRDRA
jgi:signal transduction histidine kinase